MQRDISSQNVDAVVSGAYNFNRGGGDSAPDKLPTLSRPLKTQQGNRLLMRRNFAQNQNQMRLATRQISKRSSFITQPNDGGIDSVPEPTRCQIQTRNGRRQRMITLSMFDEDQLERANEEQHLNTQQDSMRDSIRGSSIDQPHSSRNNAGARIRKSS